MISPPTTHGDDLLERVYDELRAIAARRLRAERVGHTLQPTALVHEAYLRLGEPPGGRWRGREHLLATASRAIRRVLVDHARRRASEKRGGRVLQFALQDEGELHPASPPVDLPALDDALEGLRRLCGRQARVVELRFFGGLTGDEAARALGVSPRTVDGDWKMARAWLRRELGQGAPG